MDLLLMGVAGWTLAMLFVLALLVMSSRQDRAAGDEQEEIAVRLLKHRWGWIPRMGRP